MITAFWLEEAVAFAEVEPLACCVPRTIIGHCQCIAGAHLIYKQMQLFIRESALCQETMIVTYQTINLIYYDMLHPLH